MKPSFGHLFSIALGLTGAFGLISSAAFSQSLRQQYAEDVCDWKTAEFEKMNSDIRYCIIGGKVHSSMPRENDDFFQSFEGYINKSKHDFRTAWEYALEGNELVKYTCFLEGGECDSRPTRDVVAIKRTKGWRDTGYLQNGIPLYVRPVSRQGDIVTIEDKFGVGGKISKTLVNCAANTFKNLGAGGTGNWENIPPEGIGLKKQACNSPR